MSKTSIILIVDDEEDDRLLLELAIRRSGIGNRVIALPDGQDAVDYLAGTGPYVDRKTYPLPSLIMTDFIMPRKTGLELLNWIRDDAELGSLPVVVLVGSAYETEIEMAQAAGASACFAKPVEFSELVAAVKGVVQRFLEADVPKSPA